MRVVVTSTTGPRPNPCLPAVLIPHTSSSDLDESITGFLVRVTPL
jgi:hypothetical protein